jgi:NADH:ubiquinone oxidoreductase subunit 6 (subunit J)
MSFEWVLFLIVALVTCGSAILVAVTQNIVRSAVWLLFTLAGTACLFFLLGADFVGATQLLVYVGGILILVVFGVMLTAHGPFISIKTGAGEWALGVIVALLLLGLIGGSICVTNWEFGIPRETGSTSQQELAKIAAARSSNDLGLAFLGIDSASPPGRLPLEPSKERSRVSYLLPFEIVSVHLLVVLIGAAYLARAKRRRGVPSL